MGSDPVVNAGPHADADVATLLKSGYLSTIINLVDSLKLKAVEEGVETEEQSRLLRLLNCDEMQGFLFSNPVLAEIFEAKFLPPPSGG